LRDRSGNKIQCPICRTADVHYSQSEGFRTFVMGMLFDMDALRCYTCQYLFFRRTAWEDETGLPLPPRRRRKTPSKPR